MWVIKKSLIVTLAIFLFSACFSFNNLSTHSKITNELIFFQNNRVLETIFLTKPIKNYFSSSFCVKESYIINDTNDKFGKIFFEYIDLDTQCKWTGLPRSFFETSFRFELRVDLLEVVESIEVDSYTFRTYKIDNKSFLSVIYIDSMSTNIFLIDYEGKLYTKLLKKFKSEYKNIYLNKKRYEGNYNKSLARKSFIEHYFRYEDFKL